MALSEAGRRLNPQAREGQWYAGNSHRTEQTCVSRVDLDINIHVRKLRSR